MQQSFLNLKWVRYKIRFEIKFVSSEMRDYIHKLFIRVTFFQLFYKLNYFRKCNGDCFIEYILFIFNIDILSI